MEKRISASVCVILSTGRRDEWEGYLGQASNRSTNIVAKHYLEVGKVEIFKHYRLRNQNGIWLKPANSKCLAYAVMSV